MRRHTVEQGDCVSKLAKIFGLTSQQIWMHPANARLRELRKDPNVLLPGDVLSIPDAKKKYVGCSTGHHHKFIRKGVPAKIQLRIFENGRPTSNVPYVLEIDGQRSKGVTGEDGRIIQTIAPDAREGLLELDGGRVKYSLRLGHLDPVDEVSGVQSRLKNLGYYHGVVHGQLDELVEDALRTFQKTHGLTQSGQPDASTLQALKCDHGS